MAREEILVPPDQTAVMTPEEKLLHLRHKLGLLSQLARGYGLDEKATRELKAHTEEEIALLEDTSRL